MAEKYYFLYVYHGCPENNRMANLSNIYCGLLNIGIGIRMNILMLDTRNVEQTKDVHMYT